MAALVPLISTSIENGDVHPEADVPATEFPYPEPKRRRMSDPSTEAERTDSDSTLLAEHDSVGKTATQGQPIKPTVAPTRPTISESKYQTELPARTRTKRLSPARDPGRDSGHKRQQSFSRTSSDEESSEDETELARSATEPGNRISNARLNQIRREGHGYAFRHGKIDFRNEDFHTKGRLAKDGRINISLNETANSGYLAKALGATIRSHLHHPHSESESAAAEDFKKHLSKNREEGNIPSLNIVVMVIGSRGDIQPFLKIGKILRDKYGHRVRIATHPTFRKFVEEDIGLEFFSIGGDPSELMSFMVKNPGLIPSFETIKAGEIGRRREQMFEMFQGFWRACINGSDGDTPDRRRLQQRPPFIADAIIANPPSFAHVHCAEKLNIPLHLVFTFPYSPTSQFPHPLANIKATNVDESYTNYMSYPLVDLMTWQGLGDIINRFRIHTLHLDPVSTLWAPGQLTRLRVPMTYLFSPGLVPKPPDWGPEIQIAGYVFLELADSFKPPADLVEFLDRKDGRQVIYVGFGSISGIDDAVAFTKTIFEAVEKANVRAVISRGWGGMGDGLDIPETVHLVDNVPHDWLFKKVDAVVHHGGAGTTAAGLKFGRPTMIVPFFGDQPFWSAMIARAGAGCKDPLPWRKLNVEKFANGIKQCLTPEAKEAAQAIAKSIALEGDGAENAVDFFHLSLPLEQMRCKVLEKRVAVWHLRHTELRLSALAAELLVEQKRLQWSDLTTLRTMMWQDFHGPGEPLTGAGGVIVQSFQEVVHGIASIPENTKKDLENTQRRKRRRQGRTVADAMVIPGQVAHHRMAQTSIEAERSKDDQAEPVNLLPNSERRANVNGFQRPGIQHTDTTGTTPIEPKAKVVLKDVSKGVGHSAMSLMLTPFYFWEALTLGFRNAPRLYGDKTVRPPPYRPNGLGSGMKTAGSELWFGFYDGVTGLVIIPRRDVAEGGMKALPKGVARGFGGLILKPIAGVMGVPTWTVKGFQTGVRKRFTNDRQIDEWIRRARRMQGARELQELKGEKASNNGERRYKLEEIRTEATNRWKPHEAALALARERDQKMSLWPTRLRHNSTKSSGVGERGLSR